VSWNESENKKVFSYFSIVLDDEQTVDP